MNSSWRCLEEVPGFSAVTAEWKRHTGADFDAFKIGFLQSAGRTASSFPCPHKTGCSHKVHPRGTGFVGVCKDDDGTDCDDIPLTADDVAVWELNWSLLGRAVAVALGCEPRLEPAGVGDVLQIGAVRGGCVPVLLCIQDGCEDFRRAVAELSGRLQGAFMLIAPSGGFMDVGSQALMRAAGAEFFDMETHFQLTESGALLASDAARETLARMDGPVTSKVLVPMKPTARYFFDKAGSYWDVTFDGGKTFHLTHTLGAEYLNYLLHHPSQPISAYDLEMTIRPDKVKARPKDSVQNNLDADAVRDYLRQLNKVRAQRDEAAEDGDLATVDQLDSDIEAIESELKKNGQAPDAGERSRGNVSKAIAAVQRKLRKGDAIEKAFGQHLENFVSLGYECSYNQPQGNLWG